MSYILNLRKIEGVGHRPLLMVASGVFLLDEHNRVLLEKRMDDNTWCVPGGSMELGETPEAAARREFFEETGLHLGKLEFLTVISGEDAHFTYPNGDEVYAVDFHYLCREYSGNLNAQGDEVRQLQFFALDDLPETLNRNDRNVLEQIIKEKVCV